MQFTHLFRPISLMIAYSALQVISLSVPLTKIAQAETRQDTRPFVVFVDGGGDCCTAQMNVLQNKLRLMNAEIWRTSYQSFGISSIQKSRSNPTVSGHQTDTLFLIEGQKVLNEIPEKRPVILIGQGWGGNSIIKLLPLIDRQIQFVGVLDPISSSGDRLSSQWIIPDNIGVFVNRASSNKTAGNTASSFSQINCEARIQCTQETVNTTTADLPSNIQLQDYFGSKIEYALSPSASSSTATATPPANSATATKPIPKPTTPATRPPTTPQIITVAVPRTNATSPTSSTAINTCQTDIVLQPNNADLKFKGGTRWQTCSGYRLTFQTDGNLVIYNPKGAAIWSSGTYAPKDPADTLAMQQDGNLVLYKKGTPVWASGTQSRNSALIIQANGNVFIQDQQLRSLWSSKTKGL